MNGNEQDEPAILELLRLLSEEGKLRNELVQICSSVSRNHQSRTLGRDLYPQEKEDADGDAVDFILHLSEDSPRNLWSRRGLEQEFRRFITRTKSRASTEVWKSVSRALRTLAEDGRIRRLTGELSQHNNNETVYSAADEQFDHSVIHLQELDEKASDISPLKATRRVESLADQPPSLATDSEMCKLVLQILETAKLPVALGDLHKVVEDKIIMALEKRNTTEETSNDEGDEPANNDSLVPVSMDTMIFLECEARERADLIWQQLLGRGKRLIELLCCYLLPKWLTNQNPTMSRFGTPQRVKEEVDAIQEIMALHLPDLKPDALAPGTANQKLQEVEADYRHTAIVHHASIVFSLLSKNCSENCGIGDFNN